jgi:hypothetical protein
MAMRSPDGLHASNALENMSVFSPNFNQVYNTHCATNPTLLGQVPQRCTLWELDDPITWEEFSKAVTKLKNAKVPGLTGVPKHSKPCHLLIYNMFTNMSMISFLVTLITNNGTAVSVFRYQKAATSLISTNGEVSC